MTSPQQIRYARTLIPKKVVFMDPGTQDLNYLSSQGDTIQFRAQPQDEKPETLLPARTVGIAVHLVNWFPELYCEKVLPTTDCYSVAGHRAAKACVLGDPKERRAEVPSYKSPRPWGGGHSPPVLVAPEITALCCMHPQVKVTKSQ